MGSKSEYCLRSDKPSKGWWYFIGAASLISLPFHSCSFVVVAVVIDFEQSSCGLPISLALKDNNTLPIIYAFPCGSSLLGSSSAHALAFMLFMVMTALQLIVDNPCHLVFPTEMWAQTLSLWLLMHPMTASPPVIPNLQKRPTPELHRNAWALVPVHG